MTTIPKLTTVAACRVARIDRDRFNEHVAAGRFRCAPCTVPGRARLFDPDDMIALWLFRDLMDDGYEATKAGYIACEVADAARRHPEARTISFVEDYFEPRGGRAFPAEQVPAASEWDQVLFSGTDIRKVTTFNIGKLRALIAHYTEEERSIIGERD
ncbi:hypothetical protein D3869_10005 [Azospirillum brasilense]|uniref:Uncharacterized protein n=1 Tax=Azospirillum brasilense TaxID=192 RepID=A0A4D8R4A3_AZOBR|nr:hypothetical protein [Azospirillum brasilense]QCO15536.1 hypothetical protein D3869_10005 [Azospirillum brasilense]